MNNKLLIGIVITFFFLSLAIAAYAFFLSSQMANRYKTDKVNEEKFLPLPSGSIRYQYQVNVTDNTKTIYLHGFNGSLNNWNKVWQLTNNCSSQLRLDLPGFGQSEWQSDTFDLSSQAARLIELMNYLAIDSATLVGTSMGGSIAATVAALYPERVNKLVLIAPSGYPGSLKLNFREQLVYDGLLKFPSLWLAKSHWFKSIFPDSRVIQAITVVQSYGDNWKKILRLIKQPVTLIWSKTDARVDYHYLKLVSSELENVTSVTASNHSGHDVINKDPEIIVKEVCK